MSSAPAAADSTRRGGGGKGGARGRGSDSKGGNSFNNGDGKGGRGKGPRAGGKPKTTFKGAGVLGEVAEVQKRLDLAQTRDVAAAAEETRLREELAAAEVSNAQARRRETKAREAAQDAIKHANHSHASMRADLSELTRGVVAKEQEERDHLRNVELWQSELNTMVIEQANAMQRRDILTVEVKALQRKTRKNEASAVAAEACAAKPEEKRESDRLRLEEKRRIAEDARRDLDAVQVLKRGLSAELEQLRQVEVDNATWKTTAQALAVLAAFAAAFRVSAGIVGGDAGIRV